ncbi:oxaloacetate-decarboxylating malate dehydrogenase [Leptobacterium flavescens]|uniref:Oxaloacetate-decarboxylating malate dehydrogenase n=1 Tax=Leptobacterium flavescens TaxID=472055 RepID=A0A6P0UH13_9FLAO|nr:NAD-dependent malic enzyme [Leptobacterium flavescens]NER12534.1 oxaloacetate-decarboxylating malate dehydrogenase [Leptobacterium flavescens]
MSENRKGFDILHDGSVNKSTGFTNKERDALGLRGLLPHAVSTQELQEKRMLASMRRKAYDIERYIFLSTLQDRNEKLFYQMVINNIEEIMPLIYTPTVGQACKEFSHIFRHSKGFYITPEDKGNIRNILDNWPEKDIRAIVVTDGQRILGLGDLGANGMGIPIGKLALYSACAGILPHQCLPVMLDVGTNNEEILNDILYLGYPHKRIEGDDYFELVEEFVMAVQDKYPRALIQFEDFLTPNAYALLNKYKERVLCFNDDIQGTAAVTLSGVYASTRITKKKFSDLKIMFLGAGSAATGIADLMVAAFEAEGLSNKEAREKLWFVDLNGLVVNGRTDLMPHNLPYAHDHESLNFLDAIDSIQPDVLIGATGAPGTFTKEVIEKMSAINERPVIFALSNPTSRAECTAEQAYEWSKGKAVFTSGSPFDPVDYHGQLFRPGQGNNAYIFPGIGLGAICCNASTINDPMFLTAARTLADLVEEEDIAHGTLYPPLNEIRNASLEIAVAVAEKAYEMGLARDERPQDLKKVIADYMYDPSY